MRKFSCRSLRAFALASSMMVAVAAAQVAPKAPALHERPNILLILSDDNSVPHDGCHPNANTTTFAITPNLEAFAAEGMCFDRAYAASPQCAPARGAIFAGRNPVDIGITRFSQPARPEVRYFSDLLRASGYWVGLDGRQHHLAGREIDPPHVRKLMRETGLSRIEDRFDYVNQYVTKKMPPAELRAQVEQTLDRVPKGKPFFLYFGFNQPHRPFLTDHSDIDSTKLKLPPDFPDLPSVREDYAGYLSDLREMDRQFGALMAMLKARGRADNTIVVFMGDNGEALYRGKGTLYDRGDHVPLIIRWPGVAKPGSHNASLVSGIDLAETFLEAAGARADPRMTGISLVPILRGKTTTNRREYVFSERGWHFGSVTVSEGLDYGRVITGERYTLIYNAQPGQPYSPVDQGGRFNVGEEDPNAPEDLLAGRWKSDADRALGSWRSVVLAHRAGKLPPLIDRIYFQRPRAVFELYDLKNDPYQFFNLAGQPQYKTVETKMREELDKWMVLSGDYLPLASDAYTETPNPDPVQNRQ